MKTTLESAKTVLADLQTELKNLPSWTETDLHDLMINYAQKRELKNGMVMWPIRVAATGMQVSPGGAVEALVLLGREESLQRIEVALEKLK